MAEWHRQVHEQAIETAASRTVTQAIQQAAEEVARERKTFFATLLGLASSTISIASPYVSCILFFGIFGTLFANLSVKIYNGIFSTHQDFSDIVFNQLSHLREYCIVKHNPTKESIVEFFTSAPRLCKQQFDMDYLFINKIFNGSLPRLHPEVIYYSFN